MGGRARGGRALIALTRCYRFPAAHVLRHPGFSDAENEENLGFWLYDRAEGEAAMPLGWIGDEEDKGTYRRTLLRVRQALLKRMDQLHARLKAERDKRASILEAEGSREPPQRATPHAL